MWLEDCQAGEISQPWHAVILASADIDATNRCMCKCSSVFHGLDFSIWWTFNLQSIAVGMETAQMHTPVMGACVHATKVNNMKETGDYLMGKGMERESNKQDKNRYKV